MPDDTALYPHTIKDTTYYGNYYRLACTFCGKSVSSVFQPLPTNTPDKGLIVRALITCPECVANRRG